MKKLAFSTVGCPEWDWREILATAGDLGYDGVEIRGIGRELFAPAIPSFQDAALPRTLKTLSRMGLTIPCLTSDSQLHLRDKAEETRRDLQAYIALAAKLNTPYIRVLADAPRPWPEGNVDLPLIRDSALALADTAKEKGVTLLIESNGYFADTQRLARLLDDIGHEAVAALWDIHHPYRYNDENAGETWRNIGPWVRHVHLKDSTFQERARYAMMGYGDLPLDRFFQVLSEGGYEGYYTLEWVRRWDLTLEMPGVVFAQFISYMKNLPR